MPGAVPAKSRGTGQAPAVLSPPFLAAVLAQVPRTPWPEDDERDRTGSRRPRSLAEPGAARPRVTCNSAGATIAWAVTSEIPGNDVSSLTAEVAFEGSAQAVELLSHPTLGHLGNNLWVPLADDQDSIVVRISGGGTKGGRTM